MSIPLCNLAMISKIIFEKVLRSFWATTTKNRIPRTNKQKRIGSKLAIVVGEVLGWKACELKKPCERLGIKTVHLLMGFFDHKVSTSHVSQFNMKNYKWENLGGRSAFALFHGLAGEGVPFKTILERLNASTLYYSKLQFANREIVGRIPAARLSADQVGVIPIAIKISFVWPDKSFGC